MDTTLHPDADLIDSLGGPAKISRKLGLDPSAGGTQRVQNWKYRGIPEIWRLRRPDVFGAAHESEPLARAPAATPLIDSRMSKRALRARLGLSTDKQLAKVLQLPVEQVEGWEEERALPAVPEVLRLLGAQAPAAAAPQEPEDPDAARIVPVETA